MSIERGHGEERGTHEFEEPRGLEGAQGSLGRMDFREALGRSFWTARSRLEALLEHRAFLDKAHVGKLEELVGPEADRVRVDLQLYRNWSATAARLLKAIATTRPEGETDAALNALLVEANNAVRELNLAAVRVAGSSLPPASPREPLQLEYEDSPIVRTPTQLPPALRPDESLRRAADEPGGSLRSGGVSDL
jgi:hypothetical protein